jgi:hypothetical protein
MGGAMLSGIQKFGELILGESILYAVATDDFHDKQV